VASEPREGEALGNVTREEAEARVRSFPHWYHQMEVFPGVITPGINASREVLQTLPLPADCRGLRALDVGTRDGFFAFELERRGADVVAIDHAPDGTTGYAIAKELLGSKVPYVVANVYDIAPETHGTFDLVLFLGVLYHLRDPLLALDRLAAVCKTGGRIFVESHVIDEAFLDPATGNLVPIERIGPTLRQIPIMQFYPRDALSKDFTNWWAPNMACLRAMLEMAGFVVEHSSQIGGRGLVVGRRIEDATIEYYRSIEKSIIGPRPR
jgi:tRNA (mo5U34)-methyltransferase